MSLASLLKKGSLREVATATPATFATYTPYRPPSVATVATLAVAKAQNTAANVPTPDPDLWCWPHSMVMNGAEIDTFTARLARFTVKGLSLDEGEALADKMVKRDRELDDRRLCFECLHLSGHASGSWGCRNWQRAEMANNSRDARLPVELVRTLQRCDGFIHQMQTGGQHG